MDANRLLRRLRRLRGAWKEGLRYAEKSAHCLDDRLGRVSCRHCRDGGGEPGAGDYRPGQEAGAAVGRAEGPSPGCGGGAFCRGALLLLVEVQAYPVGQQAEGIVQGPVPGEVGAGGLRHKVHQLLVYKEGGPGRAVK